MTDSFPLGSEADVEGEGGGHGREFNRNILLGEQAQNSSRWFLSRLGAAWIQQLLI